MELPKVYEPQNYEDDIYTTWEQSGYFNPDNLPNAEQREPYAIMMPPPNVTGVLHLGHALENSIMDIQVRYQRMNGKRALLLPGTDHAALPTQARVENNLKQAGMRNPRQELGREGLLKQIRDYAEQSKSTILSQIRKMGTSADWSRLAYTFDEPRSQAVNEVFKRMYDDGLIYRGYRVINWSIEGQSTSSDDELEYEERTTMLYTFQYSKDVPIPIATVLPETKLGDTAIAVHPNDDRYKQYIGQTFEVNFCGAQLKLLVVADEGVDPDYGTGALGVTPAHSMTDYEIAQNNDLPLIQVVGKDGLMTDQAGSCAGLPIKQARANVVQWLRDEELLIKEDEITHNVSLSDRYKDEIWPMPMEQWFVNVSKEIPGRGKSLGKSRGKTLKDLMREAVTTGHNNDTSKVVTITPDRFAKTYVHWIDNLHDWCISRQIWWGHRVPVWYCIGDEACKLECKQPIVSVKPPSACPHCGSANLTQDPDTLDTWFSSGMWTFSTLGWPNDTEDFVNFYPTAWMQMGHEILQLWMARMILFSTYVLDDIPFKNVYFHGILRAKDGRKFSKSLGNGVDPLDVIKQYGTDALRLSVIKGITPGNDARFYEEKVEDARNFVNKLWNISRFVMMQLDQVSPKESADLTLADQWISQRLSQVIDSVNNDIEQYRFSAVAETVYEFLWHDFADWYIEITKFQPNPALTKHVLETSLKLLHPFVPFVTEVIWKALGHEDLLMVADWPKRTGDSQTTESQISQIDKQFAEIQDIVIQIRNIRAEYKLSYKTEIRLIDDLTIWETNEDEWYNPEVREVIEKMSKAKIESGVIKGTTITNSIYTFAIKLDETEIEKERERLQNEISKKEMQYDQLRKKLDNHDYVKNAPVHIVDETKQKKSNLKTEIELLKLTLAQLVQRNQN